MASAKKKAETVEASNGKTTAEKMVEAGTLVRELVQRAAALTPVEALAFIDTKDIAIVKHALVAVVPESWRECFAPLIAELSDEHAKGVLCMIVCGYMQGANVRAIRQTAAKTAIPA